MKQGGNTSLYGPVIPSDDSKRPPQTKYNCTTIVIMESIK